MAALTPEENSARSVNHVTSEHIPRQRSVLERVVTILLLGLITGTIGSFVAVGLVESIVWIARQISTIHRPSFAGVDPVILLAPVAGGLLVGALIYLTSSPRPTSLTDLLFSVQTGNTRFSLKDGLLNALAAIVGMGSGASVGHYAPLATLGATLGCNLSRWSRTDITIGIGCGVAATISTAFSAPIAAIIFVHEVILRHYSLRAFAPITVASSTGFFIANYLLGRPPLFQVSAERSLFAPEFLAFVVIGLAGALVATVFMKSVIAVTKLAARSRMPIWVRPAVAGLGVGLLAQWIPEVMGLGGQIMGQAITEGAISPGKLALIMLAKIAATSLCIGFGFAGGIFSPSLLIGMLGGALMGNIAGIWYGELSSGLAFYGICGMVAVTSPVIGAPLTTILIVFELTRNYDLTTAVMVSVVFSNVLAYRLFGRSLFDRQLAMEGCDLSQGRDKVILQRATIASQVTTDAVVINGNQTLVEARQRLIEAGREECYVVDDLTKYLGKLKLSEILQLGQRIDISNALGIDHCDPKQLSFHHDTSVWDALHLMKDFIGESIPILDQRDYFIGIIYQSTLVAAYLNATENLRAEEHAAS